MEAFSLHQLSKTYPSFTLGPLDLELPVGMVMGFIGPNGAGKTTTLHCMAGLVRPDGGRVEILGQVADLSEAAL